MSDRSARNDSASCAKKYIWMNLRGTPRLVQSREGQVCSTGLHGKMTQDIIGEDGVERTHFPALEDLCFDGKEVQERSGYR
jgi:hypothetical protein